MFLIKIRSSYVLELCFINIFKLCDGKMLYKKSLYRLFAPSHIFHVLTGHIATGLKEAQGDAKSAG